jgi:N-methylhydantoinase B
MDQVMRSVPVGTQVIIRTGAGGGWGDPLERDPELVLADVRSGLVSVEGADRDYGVVVDARTMAVDPAQTRKRRAERKRNTAGAHAGE